MYKIALECKPDETLIKALGYTRKMIVHQPNKGRVINYLQRNPGALGIVDEDPGSPNPTFYSKFQEEFADQFNIRSLHLPKEGTSVVSSLKWRVRRS